MTFADQKAFERTQDLLYFYAPSPNGRVLYLPRSTPRSKVMDVVRQIEPVPADRDKVLPALYALWLSTKHEKMSEEDRNAMLTLYADGLAAYPAEAVDAIVAEMRETQKFWPAWMEIVERLDRITGWRGRIIRALRRLYLKLRD